MKTDVPEVVQFLQDILSRKEKVSLKGTNYYLQRVDYPDRLKRSIDSSARIEKDR